MEIVKSRFVFFVTFTSILCSETDAYGANRIGKEIKALKDDICLIREGITALFEKTNQLNVSAVEGCGRCVSNNKTSCLPSTNHSGNQDMAKVNIKDVLVKYQSLMKAFVTEKKINRELQDQLKSVEASNKVANERDRQVQDQLVSMRESIKNLQTNMTSFMSTISYRIKEHLLKAETTSVKPYLSTVSIINTNCKAVPESGVYTFYLELIMSIVTVYCDQDTDGGGWIVFMRRQNGSVNFTRPWVDYKHGFGGPDGEFWAGNELLHKLTKARPLQLRIDMEDFDGNTKFAMYEEFQVGAEEDKYRLHVRGYSGTAGDSLINTSSEWGKHAGMQFSTFDSDNDEWSGVNCAQRWKSGWWYNSCGEADLNAPYSHDKKREWPTGILWASWKGWGQALKRVEMKIR